MGRERAEEIRSTCARYFLRLPWLGMFSTAVTEIPEHLLRRSRERREALGLTKPGDAATPAPAAAESTAVEPAAAAAAEAPAARVPAVPARAPAPAPPPPPRPEPPHVAAARRRRRIPMWAMPVLAGLPIWGFIYATTLEPPTTPDDPLAVGREIYTGQCATCHGATGGGGVGPALTEGDTLLTFPDFRDHLVWVREGTEAANPDGTYGDPQREGGPRTLEDLPGTMPAFGDLTDEELLAVVRYEREQLSGADPEDEAEAELIAAIEQECPVDEVIDEACPTG
jgi:mono/diheme cytochrome c family protein